jgi:hypothetical protein
MEFLKKLLNSRWRGEQPKSDQFRRPPVQSTRYGKTPFEEIEENKIATSPILLPSPHHPSPPPPPHPPPPTVSNLDKVGQFDQNEKAGLDRRERGGTHQEVISAYTSPAETIGIPQILDKGGGGAETETGGRGGGGGREQGCEQTRVKFRPTSTSLHAAKTLQVNQLFDDILEQSLNAYLMKVNTKNDHVFQTQKTDQQGALTNPAILSSQHGASAITNLPVLHGASSAHAQPKMAPNLDRTPEKTGDQTNQSEAPEFPSRGGLKPLDAPLQPKPQGEGGGDGSGPGASEKGKADSSSKYLRISSSSEDFKWDPETMLRGDSIGTLMSWSEKVQQQSTAHYQDHLLTLLTELIDDGTFQYKIDWDQDRRMKQLLGMLIVRTATNQTSIKINNFDPDDFFTYTTSGCVEKCRINISRDVIQGLRRDQVQPNNWPCQQPNRDLLVTLLLMLKDLEQQNYIIDVQYEEKTINPEGPGQLPHESSFGKSQLLWQKTQVTLNCLISQASNEIYIFRRPF